MGPKGGSGNTHGSTQGKTRRRAASTSPQRSETSNDTDHNIDTTVIALNGNIITKLKLNANDTSLSVGHLYHHTKTNLQLREKDFALVVGTHKLDDISARCFTISAVQCASRTSTNSNISVTMIRVARTAEQPAELTQWLPSRCKGHRGRPPCLTLKDLNALNLIPAHGNPEQPVVVVQRLVIRPLNNRPIAKQVQPDSVETAQPGTATATTPADTARTTNNHAGVSQGTSIHSQTNANNDEGQHNTKPGAGTRQSKGGKAGPHGKTKEIQVHKAEAQKRGESSGKPFVTSTPNNKSTPIEPRKPSTTWFKAVGTLPMPWLKIPSPFSVEDVIHSATPEGISQPSSNGPCCHLRIISAAIVGWLCHADATTLNEGAQIILQRSIRTAGGAKHNRTCEEKDMLRDLDGPEHRATPRKHPKYPGPHHQYIAAPIDGPTRAKEYKHPSTTAHRTISHSQTHLSTKAIQAM